MTALILQSTPFVELVKPTARALHRGFLQALDAYAEARMRKAVPLRELRRAQLRIDHLRRLMHPEHKSPVTPPPARRSLSAIQ